jgi:hypothetical protein
MSFARAKPIAHMSAVVRGPPSVASAMMQQPTMQPLRRRSTSIVLNDHSEVINEVRVEFLQVRLCRDEQCAARVQDTD